MATVSEPPAGVEFVHEDDGRVTARHVETGVASFGDTEAEALRQLADAMDSHFDHGEEIDDPEAYLAELDIEVEIGEDGEPAHASDDETLTDERAAIAERSRDLEELDENEYLSVEEVAESLGIDLDD